MTLWIYSPVWHHQFVNFDDYDYVRDNPLVLGGLTQQNLLRALTTFQSHNWHPLTWFSHMLDVELWGLNAGGHHITNVLFHTANTLLLFFLFQSMTGAIWRSALVAAVFAWHPLHVESVAWIAERKDVLSTFFWILTMAAYLHYVRQPRVRRYFLVGLCFALALMSKPMAVTLPFVLLLTDYWPLGRAGLTRSDSRRWFTLFFEKLPLLGLAFISSILTTMAQARSGAVKSVLEISWPLRLSNALLSYVNYLGKTVFPSDLSVFYPLPSVIPPWQTVAAALFLLVVSAFVMAASKRHPYLVVGWLWYAGTLLPVIGLVKVGYQSMADRYTYIPMIGLTIACVWGAGDLARRSKPLEALSIALSGVCLLLFLNATSRQLRYWDNNLTLFQHALSVTSNNWLAHNNLSNALLEEHRDLGNAEFHARQALRIRPNYAEAQVDLGVALLWQGKFSEALWHLKKALEIRPGWPEAEQHLGYAQMLAGKTGEASQTFSTALRSNPNLLLALKSLAWIRATAPEPALRDSSQAIGLANRAAELTKYQDPDVLRVLAAAFAEAGEFDKAVRVGQDARKLALAQHQAKLAREIAGQMELYALALPYRDKVRAFDAGILIP